MALISRPRNWPKEKAVMESPSKELIQQAREKANLSQEAAAELIYSKRRTWQDWEAGIAKMHPGLWELFLIKTGLQGN
jgi:DNA-binding transcriptional regulator YiaG